MPSLSVGDESMQFDQYCAVGADCGSESIANGKLVEGLHTQNIELSNDKALWKEKAIMMEVVVYAVMPCQRCDNMKCVPVCFFNVRHYCNDTNRRRFTRKPWNGRNSS